MTEILCTWPHSSGNNPPAEFRVTMTADPVGDVGSMNALPNSILDLCGQCKELFVAQNRGEHLIVEPLGKIFES